MKNNSKNEEYINDDDLKRYISLPVEKKFEYIEEINKFLNSAMPKENKDIARKLKEEGF